MGGKTLFFANLFTEAAFIHCIQEPLSECSSRSGGGKWWESRAQHPGHASAGFVCAIHSPSSPASALLLLHLPSSPSETSQSAVSEWCRGMGCAELNRAFSWGLGETNAETQLDLACSEGGPFYTLSI